MILKNSTENNERDENAGFDNLEFLATISHEIRNPLNTVIGLSRLLRSPASEEDREKYLDSLLETSEHLLDLVNRLMDFSKLESSHLIPSPRPIDLKAIIMKELSVQKEIAESENLKFLIEIDNNLPDRLIVDPVLLKQVTGNLVSNAIKFTRLGTILFQVTVKKLESSKALVEFRVQDTGIGISEDKLTSIFEPFQQGADDISLTYGGTGLGLSICKQIINVLGGNLEVHSELGKGSDFSFVLELDIDRNSADISSMENFLQYQNLPKSLKVLIVDDNKLNILIVKRYLEQWDIAYEIASNGREALKIVQEQNISIVLMDLHMPVMDGLEATRQIRRLNDQKFERLPIIGLTGSTGKFLEEKVKSAGFTSILNKPFRPEDLFQKILLVKKVECEIDS